MIDEEARELFVADGYINHRIIVFDADNGAYKRHWGAYGRKPDDSYFANAGERLPGPFNGAVQHEDRPSQYDPAAAPPPQFRVVHAVRISNDGLVYVCDRTNDRIQIFRKDGTFVKETVIAERTLGSRSVWDLPFRRIGRRALWSSRMERINWSAFFAAVHWRLSANSEEADTGPASFMVPTTLRPIRKETCLLPKRTKESAFRNSFTAAFTDLKARLCSFGSCQSG